MDKIVTARGLRKCFGNQMAVAGIDFEVYPSECLGLLGPNGAGKSTTLNMLLGQIIPDAGELTVLNYSLPQEARKLRAEVGVVPQYDNLDPDFTVIENLFTYARYFGLKHRQIKSRVYELLDFAMLRHKANVKVPTLSGGMKRRLILARALLNNPKLLIFDEPTTGLDPKARQQIWQNLHLLKKQGTTQILTTHFMQEAQRLCDRVLIIDHGHILTQGKPMELIAQHIERYVFEVFGDTIDHWYERGKNLAHIRIERVGETLFCYCDDEQLMLEELSQHPNLKFIRRPGNLEDVFFKFTGRDLHDNE